MWSFAPQKKAIRDRSYFYLNDFPGVALYFQQANPPVDAYNKGTKPSLVSPNLKPNVLTVEVYAAGIALNH
jgi:hypothetical protein